MLIHIDSSNLGHLGNQDAPEVIRTLLHVMSRKQSNSHYKVERGNADDPARAKQVERKVAEIRARKGEC